MIGGFQVGAFQPLPAFQQVAVALDSERPAGGHPLRARRWADWQTRLPTPDEVRKQREALGILPKRAQQIVREMVRRAADVETPQQAATLAVAYTQELQQRAIERRLKREAERANLRWREQMAAIAQVLILDALRRKTDDEMLAAMMAAEEQERAEIGELLQIWMNL